MTTCDRFQPVVLLTDVMESELKTPEIETIFIPSSSEEDSLGSNWLHVEQTEPLDLCLNGDLVNGFAMVRYFSTEFVDCDRLSEDDDVVFVKEYKRSREKVTPMRGSVKKVGSKGAPRRNPVRKARTKRRFKEYTDGSLDDEDLFDDSEEELEAPIVSIFDLNYNLQAIGYFITKFLV